MILRKILTIIFLLNSFLFSQELRIDKVEPMNWWEGMNYDKVQLMLYGSGFKNLTVNCDGIHIEAIHEVENSDYTFIDLDLNEVKSGEYKIILSNGINDAKFTFPIYPREVITNIHNGFGEKDVIYLIMPDRFVNGNEDNDFVEGYVDTFQNQYTQSRHGGDIDGIIGKLDYLKNLGVTTLWLTPIVENNTFRSYHGYSATNFYKVDPRLGSMDAYKTLVSKAHERGLKIIMDHVSNHIAIDHPWIKNIPTKNWINGTVKKHLQANHRKMVFTDLYADSSTIKHVQEGWFVDYMPDLNQHNVFLGKYIIQNTLWWIESAGIDGIREDTYPYCNQAFMSKWAKTILNEYPRLNIVGEVWTGNPVFLSGYQGGNKLKDRETNLPAVTDFGMRDALANYLSGKASIDKFYEILASDYLYPNPNNLVTFIDNHDVGRAMFYAKSNTNRFKIAFHLLLTTRGIPQIFYGTEIGMKANEDHGTLRMNFPGGFPNDKRDAFTDYGRTKYENEIFYFFKRELKLRKEYPALSSGKLIHFPPVNGVYVYFKSFKNELIMNVINTSDEKKNINLEDYITILKGKNEILNLFSSAKTSLSKSTSVSINSESFKMYLVK